jgi:hypothetical protein
MDASGIDFDVFDPTEVGSNISYSSSKANDSEKSNSPELNRESFEEIFRRAEEGNAYWQNKLGIMYYNGDEITQNYSLAAYWIQKAADQGLYSAQFNLGMLYFNGEGVIQDYQKAYALFQKAAVQRSINAQYMLGKMYYIGLGIKRDVEKSYMWFNIAASFGHKKAKEERDRLQLYGKRLIAAQKLSSDCVARNYRGC